MTLADYFTKNCYEGEIYKTVNLRNQSLSQYCKNDSAVKKEQKNIEKQLSDFRKNLWVQPAAAADSTTTVATDSASTVKAEAKEEKPKRTTKKETESKASKKSSNKSSGKSGAPRVSVRRVRR